MIVLLGGAVCGNYPIHWSILLNLPWFVLPVVALIEFLSTPGQIGRKLEDFWCFAAFLLSIGTFVYFLARVVSVSGSTHMLTK